mgnify:CR=1 FL=1
MLFAFIQLIDRAGSRRRCIGLRSVRRGLGVWVTLLASLLGFSNAATLPSGNGLAAQYPGDAGIERDPQVVQVESFEQADVSALVAGWENVGGKRDFSLSSDVPSGSAGKQSLLMERQSGPGGSLYRRLRNPKGGF